MQRRTVQLFNCSLFASNRLGRDASLAAAVERLGVVATRTGQICFKLDSFPQRAFGLYLSIY